MLRLSLLSHVPMFGFTALAFLIVCAILAIATYLVFNSGEQGKTKLGGCAGCAVGFALLAIAGLAAAFCVGVMLLTAPDEIVRHGPVKSFELDFGDRDHGETQRSGAAGAPGKSSESLHPVTEDRNDSQHTVHLKLVIRGKEYPASISEWVRENTKGDVSVTITTQGNRTVVDYGLPVTRAELDKFKGDLKQALPGLKLPKGVKVEIKDADD